MQHGAHPRVCGEHGDAAAAIEPSWGSSPRLRGARLQKSPAKNSIRLIPASAGSTMSGRPLPTYTQAHPRVCGEHVNVTYASLPGRGSSPRLRGARDRKCAGIGVVGLIPASAGSTLADKHFQ